MSQAISIFNRPRLDTDLPAPPALSISGTLDDYEQGEAYSQRLQINNAIGKCTVEVLSSDLPNGALVYVDNLTSEVVVRWPGFELTATGLLQNGGFEEGSVGWALAGPWEINNTGDAEEGSYSAEFKTGTAGEFAMIGAAVPVTVPTTIVINGRVQQGASSASNAGAGVGLRWYGSGDSVLSDTVGPLVESGSGGAWNTASHSGSAPLGATRVAPLVRGFRKRENKPLWVDGITWDHEYFAGSDSDVDYSLSLEVTDSAGRTASWSGTIEAIPLGPTWGELVALLHFDGTNGSTAIYDERAQENWINTGTPALSNTYSAFGGTSLYVDAPSYISLTDASRWDFGSGDFFIEAVIRPNGTGTQQRVIGQWGALGQRSFLITITSSLAFNVSVGGASYNADFAGSIVANVPTRIAAGRRGDNTYVWVNGVISANVGSLPPGAVIQNPINPIVIGDSSYAGYIDELRVAKITPPVGNYTVPVAAYPNPAAPPLVAPGAHRYWRINVLTNQGSTQYYGMTEVRLRDAAGNDVSTGSATSAGKTTSSEINIANAGWKAFDNIITGGWLSATAVPSWVTVDMASNGNVISSAPEIKTISMYGSSTATASPKSFNLEYSDNGSTWTVARFFEGIPVWTANQLRTFTVF